MSEAEQKLALCLSCSWQGQGEGDLGWSEGFLTLLFTNSKAVVCLCGIEEPGEVPCSAHSSLSLLGQSLVPAAISWGQAPCCPTMCFTLCYEPQLPARLKGPESICLRWS